VHVLGAYRIVGQLLDGLLMNLISGPFLAGSCAAIWVMGE
jgi:hypothetical protein